MSLALGIAPHDIEQWPAKTVAEFRAYDQLQPFGDERANWHSAMIAHLLAVIHTPKGKTLPEITDFLWTDAETRKEQDEGKLLNWLRAMKRGKPRKARRKSRSADGEVPSRTREGESKAQ